IAGAVIFSAVFVATAAVAFWWIESGELGNALTYGGHDFTAYPIGVYGALFRRLFAYALGFAFVPYYPALALLGPPHPLGGPAGLPGWARGPGLGPAADGGVRGDRRGAHLAHRCAALSEHRIVTVIETHGLRRDFAVRLKRGWLRRETRVIAAVDGIDLSVE